MSCSLNEGNLNQLRHLLQACLGAICIQYEGQMTLRPWTLICHRTILTSEHPREQTILVPVCPSDSVCISQALCLGLCLNTSVTQLELRGNNVRGPGTEHLATMLRKNRHIQTLTLEWNNLGTIKRL